MYTSTATLLTETCIGENECGILTHREGTACHCLRKLPAPRLTFLPTTPYSKSFHLPSVASQISLGSALCLTALSQTFSGFLFFHSSPTCCRYLLTPHISQSIPPILFASTTIHFLMTPKSTFLVQILPMRPWSI